MLFTEPHEAVLRTKVKDAYGTVTTSSDLPFQCYAERRAKFSFNGNQQVELGKGTVYTTFDSTAFTVGAILVVNAEEYTIRKADRYEGMDSSFSHWELVYG